MKEGGFTKNGKDCPITAPPSRFFGFLGSRRQERAFSHAACCLVAGGQVSQETAERGRPRRPRALLGLLAAYLPCGRVSQVAAKEARPPTRASLLAPTCRIDGWMLHRTRSDNGQLGPIYALTCEARVAESMHESWGLMDYSTRAEERPTNNKRGAGSKAVRGGRCFLRLDGAAEDGPSAHDRGSSGD